MRREALFRLLQVRAAEVRRAALGLAGARAAAEEAGRVAEATQRELGRSVEDFRRLGAGPVAGALAAGSLAAAAHASAWRGAAARQAREAHGEARAELSSRREALRGARAGRVTAELLCARARAARRRALERSEEAQLDELAVSRARPRGGP